MFRKIIFNTFFCFFIILGIFMHLPLCAMAIETGGVMIEIKTYSLDGNGQRIPCTGQDGLVPNQKIPYIINVENKESLAWIRMKVDYQNSDQKNSADDSWLQGINQKAWVKRGEYWYYMKPVAGGDSVDFCSGIRVPDLTYAPEEIQFKIISHAEAVQAANVTPDFALDNPFEGLMIDCSTLENRIDLEVTGFEIRYENGADNIVDISDLFQGIDGMMPGDVKIGTVRIINSNIYRIRVVLTETGSQVSDLLLKEMKLTISKNGNALYDGSITDNSIVNGLSLGDFAARSETEVEFRLELPSSAENETAFHNMQVAWVFSAEHVEPNSGISGGSSGTSYTMAPVIYSCPDGSVRTGYTNGHWNLINERERKWEYILPDGRKASNGWMYLYNPYSQDSEKFDWFCFDADGIMQWGWIKTDNGNWYFCNATSDGRLGRLVKGWHNDADDGRTYYLDPVTGIMQSGWREIDGKYYYFAAVSDIPRQNWFWNTGIGKWVYDFLGYRTYGSLYRNEKTPDGYQVDADGIWNGDTDGGRQV